MISLIVAIAYLNSMNTVIEPYYDIYIKSKVENAMVASIGVEAESEFFFATFLTDTYVVHYQDAMFRPFYVVYTADIGVKYKNLRLGYRDVCNHVVKMNGYEDDYPVFGGQQQIYIQGKFTVYK